jgi:DNA-binding response OmpR family regulator
MTRKRILVVEDDHSIASLLKDNLEYEGFEVAWAADGSLAMSEAGAFEPDLVLLDLMLPGLTGFDVCRKIRSTYPDTAVVMVTVRDSKEDKVQGLELGADDYVTKPFELRELLARIHAVLRRTRPSVERLALGDVVVDFRRFTAERRGIPLVLTQREFDLLRYLSEHLNHVVSREELLRAVWGYRELPTTRTVDNFVARLRRKIEMDPRHPRYLHTSYGDGYSLTALPRT